MLMGSKRFTVNFQDFTTGSSCINWINSQICPLRAWLLPPTQQIQLEHKIQRILKHQGPAATEFLDKLWITRDIPINHLLHLSRRYLINKPIFPILAQWAELTLSRISSIKTSSSVQRLLTMLLGKHGIHQSAVPRELLSYAYTLRCVKKNTNICTLGRIKKTTF